MGGREAGRLGGRGREVATRADSEKRPPAVVPGGGEKARADGPASGMKWLQGGQARLGGRRREVVGKVGGGGSWGVRFLIGEVPL